MDVRETAGSGVVSAAKITLVLTDCVPAVATSPTASVAEIPAGGVRVVENEPFASDIQWSILRDPSVADMVRGNPEIGSPNASLAGTIASLGPVGFEGVAGVASIVNEAMDAS